MCRKCKYCFVIALETWICSFYHFAQWFIQKCISTFKIIYKQLFVHANVVRREYFSFPNKVVYIRKSISNCAHILWKSFKTYLKVCALKEYRSQPYVRFQILFLILTTVAKVVNRRWIRTENIKAPSPTQTWHKTLWVVSCARQKKVFRQSKNFNF